MKQVLITKLKLVPTTEQQKLLWDISLASQDVLNYASRVAWLLMSQLSSLSGEYISLVRRAVWICHSFFFEPKRAIFLTQELGLAIHSTPRKRRVPRRVGKDFLYNLFNKAYGIR